MPKRFLIRGRLPKAPQRYDAQNEAETRRIIELAVLDEGDGNGLSSRRTVDGTTGVLDPCESELGSLDMGAPGMELIIVVSDGPARLRLYATAAARDADVERPSWVNPEPGLGVLLDLLLEEDEGQTYLLSPAVFLYNADTPVAETLYYNVQNQADEARAVTLGLVVITLEVLP